MDINQEKPVCDGYLLFPPQGKIVLKKSWQSKYCLLFNASKLGIERLEVYDNIDDYPKQPPYKIFTLENCIKISQRDPYSFTIITRTWSQNFGTQTFAELSNWISAFQSVAFKDDLSRNLSIVEDNELYCSSGEGIFTVKLFPSEASKRCGLEPKTYILVISSTSTKLKDCETSKTLFTWPHRYIRRYGYRDGKFTFEAGRKCDSGEGSFHLEHSNQQEIFRCLSSKMKSMRKLLNGETPTTVLDCGDNQFQAALCMEARSRSPLPPSPTSSTKYRDLEPLSSSQSATVNNQSTKLPYFTDKQMPNSSCSKPLTKPKPMKPPRKHIPVQPQSDYEPICTLATPADYDRVEIRNEAWKTLGVDDVKHSETIESDNSDSEPFPSRITSKSQENLHEDVPPLPPVSKIIQNTNTFTSNSDSYDKLQFFGSSSKLNDLQGYKQVNYNFEPKLPSPAADSVNKSRMWNDYEEVQALKIDMEAVRLADDSHLGYGMIRKQSATKVVMEEPVPHHVVNDTAYAIISKPKRV